MLYATLRSAIVATQNIVCGSGGWFWKVPKNTQKPKKMRGTGQKNMVFHNNGVSENEYITPNL